MHSLEFALEHLAWFRSGRRVLRSQYRRPDSFVPYLVHRQWLFSQATIILVLKYTETREGRSVLVRTRAVVSIRGCF